MKPVQRLLLAMRPLIERFGHPAMIGRLTSAFADSDQTRVFRLRSGVSMKVTLADRVQCAEAFGLYERKELRLATKRLSPRGGVFLDVGAHIGYYALHAARATGSSGTVLAFEAARGNAQRLRENIELNPGGRVELVEAAATAQEGSIIFHEVDVAGETGWGSLLLDAGATTREIEVRAVTIDGVVSTHGLTRVDAMKLDVQGAELDVLRGAEDTIRRFRPAILCEVLDVYWGSEQDSTAGDLLDHLTERGYVPHRIGVFGRVRRLAPERTLTEMNVVFLHGGSRAGEGT